MGLNKGHKLKDVTKDERFEVRMTSDQFRDLEQCAEALHVSKTQVLLDGLQMVKEQTKKTV